MKMKYIVTIFIIMANIANAALKFEDYVYEKQTTDDVRFVEFVFKFKNISDLPISILNIDADCGCINASTDKTILKKDEYSRITGTLSIEGKIGLIEKNVIIMTDSIVNNKINLKIKVNILPVLNLDKRFLFWRVGEAANIQKIKAILKNTTYKFQDISYDKKVLSVNVEHISPLQLRLDVLPLSTTKRNKTLLSLTLIGENGNEKKYLIPVYVK